MEDEDLNESVNLTESSTNDDDELMMINNNQTVIRGRNGSFTSRTNGPLTSRSNGPLTSRTNEPLTSRANGSIALERGVRGKVITINRAKHYGFIKRSDNVESRDIFYRDASIINETRQQKLFLNDHCKFDIIRTPRGIEAINIAIEKRHIDSVGKLPKIPKKQQTNIQPQVSEDLFKSTIAELFKEALRKR